MPERVMILQTTINKSFKHMKKDFALAALAAAVMMSCGSTKSVGDATALNGEWNIMEVNGSKVDKADVEEAPFLGFDAKDNNVYGCTGCNRLTGTLKVKGNGGIDFGQMGCTQMLCANMEVERLVLDALGKTAKYSLDGTGKLTLTDKSGKTVILLEKRK